MYCVTFAATASAFSITAFPSLVDICVRLSCALQNPGFYHFGIPWDNLRLAASVRSLSTSFSPLLSEDCPTSLHLESTDEAPVIAGFHVLHSCHSPNMTVFTPYVFSSDFNAFALADS